MAGSPRILRLTIILSLVVTWPAFAGQFFPDNWSEADGADVVILGEIHDNPHHHRNQAAAVAALNPSAMVFEQLTPDLAGKVTPSLLSDAQELGATLEWDARGWPDFAMYYPIFAAAPKAAIHGGGAPRTDVRRAIDEGAAAVFGQRAELLGLDQSYSEDVQADLEALQQTAHCDALPAEMLPGMVEAQRLRDATLADAVLQALRDRKGDDGPVIVITGNGHATNTYAVPALLRRANPGLVVFSVGQFEDAAPEAPDFDRWIVTDAVDRDDPCAVFKN
ncbi:MAG: ChaN family lipoprotein [Boseongicola sp.]|nr:ChaN family lipoprotein [Boseongicola sp.]